MFSVFPRLVDREKSTVEVKRLIGGGYFVHPPVRCSSDDTYVAAISWYKCCAVLRGVYLYEAPAP